MRGGHYGFNCHRFGHVLKKYLSDLNLMSGLKKSVVEAAKKACLEHHRETMAGRPGNSLQYRMAKNTGTAYAQTPQ